MRSIHFDPDAWEDFLYWLGADRKMAKRITRLIGEIQRDPFSGIGKPEPLKGDLSGYWSRRIDDEHRLVYRADDKEVKILKARYTRVWICKNPVVIPAAAHELGAGCQPLVCVGGHPPPPGSGCWKLRVRELGAWVRYPGVRSRGDFAVHEQASRRHRAGVGREASASA